MQIDLPQELLLRDVVKRRLDIFFVVAGASHGKMFGPHLLRHDSKKEAKDQGVMLEDVIRTGRKSRLGRYKTTEQDRKKDNSGTVQQQEGEKASTRQVQHKWKVLTRENQGS